MDSVKCQYCDKTSTHFYQFTLKFSVEKHYLAVCRIHHLAYTSLDDSVSCKITREEYIVSCIQES